MRLTPSSHQYKESKEVHAGVCLKDCIDQRLSSRPYSVLYIKKGSKQPKGFLWNCTFLELCDLQKFLDVPAIVECVQDRHKQGII